MTASRMKIFAGNGTPSARAEFTALGCGANPEAWTEIVVQLLDAEDTGAGPMAAGKFAAIIRKVSEHVGLDAAARLTFEVSGYCAPSARQPCCN